MICPNCLFYIDKIDFEESINAYGKITAKKGSQNLLTDNIKKFTCPLCNKELESIKGHYQALLALQSKEVKK